MAKTRPATSYASRHFRRAWLRHQGEFPRRYFAKLKRNPALIWGMIADLVPRLDRVDTTV